MWLLFSFMEAIVVFAPWFSSYFVACCQFIDDHVGAIDGQRYWCRGGSWSCGKADGGGAAANVSVAVVHLSRTTLATSASILGELWDGVDVLNVSFDHAFGQALAYSRHDMTDWVTAGAGGYLEPVVASHAAAFIRGIKVQMPISTVHTEKMMSAASFTGFS